jgi:hypothetical protein
VIAALRHWPARRWLTALAAGAAFVIVVAIPTDLVDTPIFGREVPPTWWAWPSLILSSILAGLLVGSYVAAPARVGDDGRARRGGWIGSALTYFAVGCPVCNKLVLLALGSAGAMTWFQPVQPLLQVAAVTLLAWALRRRLLGEISCPTDLKEVQA